jgi:two-component system chemotaxis response regulator CheY
MPEWKVARPHRECGSCKSSSSPGGFGRQVYSKAGVLLSTSVQMGPGAAFASLPGTMGAAPAQVVLVVEDDSDASALYHDLLESEGFAVELARDGIEAIFKARARTPVLVLLDLGLPRLDGFYLADLWKRDSEMAAVPILAVSGFLDSDNVQRALAAGCTETLGKPFSVEDLRRAIRRLLHLGESASASGAQGSSSADVQST